jgi:hypothetical protein
MQPEERTEEDGCSEEEDGQGSHELSPFVAQVDGVDDHEVPPVPPAEAAAPRVR